MKHFTVKNFFVLLTLSLVCFLSSCSIIETLTDEGPAPVISGLTVTPKTGSAPLLSTVSWTIAATDPQGVSCELDYGDGKKESVENCSQLNNAFHTYEKAGGYIVVLKVRQGRQEISRSATVTVQEGAPPSQGALSITNFEATPATGSAPLRAMLEWQISNTLNTPVTCDINFGDGQNQSVENCNQVNFLFHTFEQPGGYVMTLKARTEGQEVTSSFPITVQGP